MLDSSDIPEQGLSQQRTVLSCSPLLNNQDPESMGHSCDMWLRLILVTELGYWWERDHPGVSGIPPEISRFPVEWRLVRPMRLALPTWIPACTVVKVQASQ